MYGILTGRRTSPDFAEYGLMMRFARLSPSHGLTCIAKEESTGKVFFAAVSAFAVFLASKGLEIARYAARTEVRYASGDYLGITRIGICLCNKLGLNRK